MSGRVGFEKLGISRRLAGWTARTKRKAGGGSFPLPIPLLTPNRPIGNIDGSVG
jgi:hypothetical protein